MKKITLLIVLITLCFNYKALSQNGNYELALKAGINYSDLIIDKNIPAKMNAKFGFHIGGIVNIQLSNKISLKPELIFSTSTTEYELNDNINLSQPTLNEDPSFVGTNQYIADIKESSILVPILIEYDIRHRIDIEFGPQLGYLINQNISDNNENLNYDEGNDKFEFAFDLGVGYHFSNDFRLGIRYYYGITKRNNTNSSIFQIGMSYNL